MLKEAFDRDELNRYVQAIRANLDAPALADAAQQAAPVLDGDQDPQAAVRANLKDVTDALASSGGRTTPRVPFLARDPVHSILQSTVESKLREQGVEDAAPPHREGLAKLIHTCESFLHPLRYGPTNVDWVIDVGKAMLAPCGRGQPSVQPEAGEAGDDQRRRPGRGRRRLGNRAAAGAGAWRASWPMRSRRRSPRARGARDPPRRRLLLGDARRGTAQRARARAVAGHGRAGSGRRHVVVAERQPRHVRRRASATTRRCSAMSGSRRSTRTTARRRASSG